MGDILAKYGTSNQAITITLNSLANSAVGVGRASTVVDNSTNKFLDAAVSVKLTAAAASVATTGIVFVYAYGTADNGSNYTESATGSDAALTLTQPNNARLIGTINVVANNGVYNAGPFSVAKAFGFLPEKWGIIVVNNSGAALAAAGNSAWYQGQAATN